MSEIHGFCDDRFQPLAELFRSNQDDGTDEGASLAVTFGGEFVVDLWAGTMDRKRTKPWEKDTLANVFSTSKVMVVISTLMMWERGLIDLHRPIAAYWPEFAQNGKETITPWQVLVHRSGLPGFGQPIGFEEMHDWEHMIDVLERAEPWMPPDTVSCYHNWTFGYMLGELVRRVTGRPFDVFFRDEIATPLGADFHFGLTSPDDQARVAQLWYTPISPLPNEIAQRVFDEVEFGDWVVPSRMASVIPAGSGLGNARSMARIGAMLAMGGELDGRQYLSRGTIEAASSEQSYESDLVLGPCRYGLGFGLDSPEFRSPTPTSFHWGGYGGSFMTMDMASGISSAFVPNRLRMSEEAADGPAGPHADRLMQLFRVIGEVTRSVSAGH